MDHELVFDTDNVRYFRFYTRNDSVGTEEPLAGIIKPFRFLMSNGAGETIMCKYICQADALSYLDQSWNDYKEKEKKEKIPERIDYILIS